MGARETFFQTEAQGVDAPWAPGFPTFGEIEMRDEKLRERVESGQAFVEKPGHPRFADLTGRSYGKLTVLGFLGRRGRVSRWACKCACGGVTEVSLDNLRDGKTKSCGCLVAETGRSRITHGGSGTVLYQVWADIVRRCTNSRCPTYKHYGGRGITIHGAFESFGGFRDWILANLGERPSSGYSIDRIDNDGAYEPGNLRWATQKQQRRNTRANRVVEVNGETMCAKDAAALAGITLPAFLERLKRGMPPQQAAIEKKAVQARLVGVNGVPTPVTKAAAAAGMSVQTFTYRLGLGWPVDKALNEPVRGSNPKRGKGAFPLGDQRDKAPNDLSNSPTAGEMQ